MKIHTGAKLAVLAAVAAALLTPNTVEAAPTGRKLSKLPQASADLGRNMLASFELSVVNRDVRQLLNLMRLIVNRPVLNRDAIHDRNTGLQEVGRIPLRMERMQPSEPPRLSGSSSSPIMRSLPFPSDPLQQSSSSMSSSSFSSPFSP